MPAGAPGGTGTLTSPDDGRRWAVESRQAVADTLEALRRHGWMTLHHAPLPGRRSMAIPHIAVGPGGIVVVTVGDGPVADTPCVEGAASAAAEVTALLDPAHRRATRAVLCLTDADHDAASVGPGVTVVGRRQLTAHLTALPRRLDRADAQSAYRHLQDELPGAMSRRPLRPRAQHRLTRELLRRAMYAAAGTVLALALAQQAVAAEDTVAPVLATLAG